MPRLRDEMGSRRDEHQFPAQERLGSLLCLAFGPQGTPTPRIPSVVGTSSLPTAQRWHLPAGQQQEANRGSLGTALAGNRALGAFWRAGFCMLEVKVQ